MNTASLTLLACLMVAIVIVLYLDYKLEDERSSARYYKGLSQIYKEHFERRDRYAEVRESLKETLAKYYAANDPKY